MRVVDLAVCEGYAQCAFLAPDAFRLSGPGGLMYDLNPPGPEAQHSLTTFARRLTNPRFAQDPPPYRAQASATRPIHLPVICDQLLPAASDAARMS